MFEHKTKPVANKKLFYIRIIKFLLLASLLIGISLMIGTFGYMHFGNLNFLDAFYNASMILTGMGPAVVNPNEQLKIFASFYALYSSIVFLSSVGIAFTPVIHRFFHLMHIEK